MKKEELVFAIKEFCQKTGCEQLNAEELAEHLITKGVKVEPVKVGDKIFKFDTFKTTILEYTVVEVSEVYNHFYANDCHGCKELFFFDRIGKKLFLSRDDAEQELVACREKWRESLGDYGLPEEEWDGFEEYVERFLERLNLKVI